MKGPYLLMLMANPLLLNKEEANRRVWILWGLSLICCRISFHK